MKDKILYYLYLLGSFNFFKKIYILYYRAAIIYMKWRLNKSAIIDHALLKGSFNQDYFSPVVSDLDFIIIGRKDSQSIAKVEQIFKAANKFFPMVSDFDFFSKKEFEIYKRFSGVKLFFSDQWTIIKGTEQKSEYLFHPRKYYYDLYTELFFQYVWLFENIKKRTRAKSYVTINLCRQYYKMKELARLLTVNEFEKPVYKKFHYDKAWENKSNEEILFLCLELINIPETKRVLNWLKSEQKYHEVDSFMEHDYYKEHLQVIETENFVLDKTKEYFFSKDLFELFHLIGCLESYVIYEWTKRTKDYVASRLLKGMYISKIIEGYVNDHHDSYSIEKLLNEFDQTFIDENLDIFLNEYRRHTYLNQNVLVTICNTEDRESIFKHMKYALLYSKQSKSEIKQLNICFGSQNYSLDPKFYKLINLLTIKESSSEEIRKSEEELYYQGALWAFGAKSIVLCDSLLLIKNKDIEEILNEKLDENTVLNFSSSRSDFLWGLRADTLLRLGSIVEMSFTGDRNTLFHYQLTGELMPESNPRILRNKHKHFFDTQHKVINHELDYIKSTSKYFDSNFNAEYVKTFCDDIYAKKIKVPLEQAYEDGVYTVEVHLDSELHVHDNAITISVYPDNIKEYGGSIRLRKTSNSFFVPIRLEKDIKELDIEIFYVLSFVKKFRIRVGEIKRYYSDQGKFIELRKIKNPCYYLGTLERGVYRVIFRTKEPTKDMFYLSNGHDTLYPAIFTEENTSHEYYFELGGISYGSQILSKNHSHLNIYDLRIEKTNNLEQIGGSHSKLYDYEINQTFPPGRHIVEFSCIGPHSINRESFKLEVNEHIQNISEIEFFEDDKFYKDINFLTTQEKLKFEFLNINKEISFNRIINEEEFDSLFHFFDGIENPAENIVNLPILYKGFYKFILSFDESTSVFIELANTYGESFLLKNLDEVKSSHVFYTNIFTKDDSFVLNVKDHKTTLKSIHIMKTTNYLL